MRAKALARALVRKRGRAVARAWPALARCLGADFGAHFAAYATRNPPPPECDTIADGLMFATSLRGAVELDDDARLELLLTCARYVLRGGRISRRRIPFVGAFRARARERFVLVLGIPALGVSTIALPYRWPQ